MGNKEGKFKKIFEEIDTSGDCKVSIDELINFLGEKLLFLFRPQALKL
jgi:Ca2+-binding EF-hand superfamily protein